MVDIHPGEPRHDTSIVDVYFAALDAGDSERAAACFAVNGEMRLPSTTETATRTVVRGEQITARLAQRGAPPWRHRLTTRVLSGSTTLVEGEVVDDSGVVTATFFALIAVDSDGLIGRYHAFRRPGAVRAAISRSGGEHAASTWLREACSSTYESPHVPATLVDPICSVALPKSVARDELRDGFVTLLPEMQIEAIGSSGSTALAVGTSRDPLNAEGTVDFAVAATFDDVGAIDRLVLYWTEAGPPRESDGR